MPDLPWLYLAVAILACAAVVCHGIVRRSHGKRQASLFIHAADAGSAPEHDAAHARALLAGLIPAVQTRSAVDSLDTGLPRSRVSALLAEQWGVRTPGDLRATLAWLLHQGDRSAYRQVVHIATTLPPEQWLTAICDLGEDYDHQQLYRWATNLVQSLPTLRRAGFVRSPADLERDIAAWDMARAIQLARLGHDAALAATGAAWIAIHTAAAQMYDRHASWRDAAAGYLLGQAMHAGAGPVLEQACEAVRACLNHGTSPWRQHPFVAVRPRKAPGGHLFDRAAHPPAA